MSASAPRRIYIDLSIVRTPALGNGERIPEQFKQLLLLDTNDNDNTVDIVIGREFSGNAPVKYTARDSVEVVEDGTYIEGATIYNYTSQPGKYLYAEIHFNTKRGLGSLSLNGQFEIVEPSSGDEDLKGITTGGVCQLLIAADSTRKNLGIYNGLTLSDGGYIKFVENNLLIGRYLAKGGYHETKNRGAVYFLAPNAEAANSATGAGVHLTPEY